MKILNLYAGIGGNRQKWGNNHYITAVEQNPQIAQIYKDFFPQDNVIVDDAHEYLLRHFREYDFIWASPPCQTHSLANLGNINRECFNYPDMKLYQEILLLKTLYKGQWIVENVTPYYKPFITPNFKIGRHLFWGSTFMLSPQFTLKLSNIWESVSKMEKAYNIDLKSYKLHYKLKRKILRNCVNPEIGEYIFNQIIRGLKNE